MTSLHLSDEIGSHEAAKVLARESINQTLYELQDGSYSFTDYYALHDLMRSIQIWIHGQKASSSRFSALVAIGGYRCGCTDLEEALESIPVSCPHHDRPLYRSPEWVEDVNDVPLGFEIYTEKREKQMLIDLIVSSVEEEGKRKETKKQPKKQAKHQSLDMSDI